MPTVKRGHRLQYPGVCVGIILLSVRVGLAVAVTLVALLALSETLLLLQKNEFIESSRNQRNV